MPSNWYDSARTMLEGNPELAGRILRELLKIDLPPVIQYTVLTPFCSTDPYGDDSGADDLCDESPPGDDSPDEPVPEMVILAGPVSEPVRAVVVEFLRDRQDAMRRQWPLHLAAVWLAHECPVDLLVFCPDELTARWADRPIATSLDGYVCRPEILVLEDLGNIAS
ncbi:MAG: hypothetical protein J2P25_18885 [Nocardiopsaceae bacterium]|nr:hypothetical protein [Nocardiopsaceae bacterium]